MYFCCCFFCRFCCCVCCWPLLFLFRLARVAYVIASWRIFFWSRPPPPVSRPPAHVLSYYFSCVCSRLSSSSSACDWCLLRHVVAAGGARDCDHWHDGAGFVTSHIAVSLMFEQSLQSVNPSISLPYWDFTVEGMLYDWTNFRNSGVFADDWFGDAAPRNVSLFSVALTRRQERKEKTRTKTENAFGGPVNDNET